VSVAAALLAELHARGVRVKPRPATGKLWVKPLSAIDPLLRARLNAHKAELLALLTTPAISDREEDAIDRIAMADGWQTPSEIPSGVACEIRRIEAEALQLGWRSERLWNFHFWPNTQNRPRAWRQS